MFGRIGVALTVVAAFIQFIALVARGLAADPVRVPWGNMYEFTLIGTWVVIVGYLALYKRFGLSWLSPVVTSFVLVTLMVDVLLLYTPVVPAARRPAVALAGDPRGRRDHRDRRLHPRRHVLGAVPGQAALGGEARRRHHPVRRLPRAAAEARGARPDRLPHARLRLPDLDLRGPHRRPDLGAATPGAATGAGTPRRSGRSSPGSSTPPTCTPARPPAGRAARPRSSRWSASRRCGSTSSGSTSSSAAAASTPTPPPSRSRSSERSDGSRLASRRTGPRRHAHNSSAADCSCDADSPGVNGPCEGPPGVPFDRDYPHLARGPRGCRQARLPSRP